MIGMELTMLKLYLVSNLNATKSNNRHSVLPVECNKIHQLKQWFLCSLLRSTITNSISYISQHFWDCAVLVLTIMYYYRNSILPCK